MKDIIGKVKYVKQGQIILDEQGRLILDIRCWGWMQNYFKSETEAIKFQDKLGEFVAQAINEKLERVND